MKRSLVFVGAFIALIAQVYACSSSPDGGAPLAVGLPARDDAGLTPGEADGGTGGLCANRNPLKTAYFGDLHAHTSFSYDAFSFDTRNTPMDAYAFARGKTVQVAAATPGGSKVTTTIERPLDFLAVTDHSEWLALAYGCGDTLAGPPQGSPQSSYYGDPSCVLFRSTDPTQQNDNFRRGKQLQSSICDAGADCAPVVQSAWEAEQSAAAAANDPCKFTSLVAYEYTRAVQSTDGSGSATLHKNVIFGSDKVPKLPIDSFNFPSQVELWTALDQQCLAADGCQAITIPHNSNLSQGLAFSVAVGAEPQLVKYQRLVEIFQHKGGSECFYDPANPTDPDCNFEYLGVTDKNDLKQSYVRYGLEKGIIDYSQSKVNAFQMGIVAATDDHNGAPGNTREDTFPGHAGRNDDSPAQRIGLQAGAGGATKVAVGHNPGGLAVVWAEQNTRDSIFGALYRRETYGTSGTRIQVRFYQTWDTGTDLCADPSFPANLVAAGAIPMGGTIAPPPAGAKSPRFVAYAWKDKTELARIDLVKSWVDVDGTAKEKVVPFPLTAGAPACVTWTDDAFTGTPAFYYTRVLEQPTPRWSAIDCASDPSLNPTECAPGGALNRTIQERAWTSPIWFLP